MKNNFVATFMLLLAGIIFNDVASVHGKPTKRDRRLQQQLQQVNIAATDAVYRCHGTFSNYKEPQQCNKASHIKSVLVNGCNTVDPIFCQLLSDMNQAEMNAYRDEGVDNARRALGDNSVDKRSLGGGANFYPNVDTRSLGD